MSNIIENKPVPQSFWPKPIKKEDYVMGDGNLVTEVLMPTGHGWGAHLPLGETQFKNGIDPSSCPAGGTLNAVEAIGKFKYGASFQNDLSERYLSIMSGMTGYGGNPFQVAEIMRTISGAVPEVYLPFDMSIDSLQKYFRPKPMPYWLFKIGVHWKKIYEFKHEWVFHPGQSLSIEEKRQRLQEALKYSPVGVSGYAWSLHSDGKYYHDGPDIHWFIKFDWKEGESHEIFDTYPPYVKNLDWNYDFGYAERYSLTRKLGAEVLIDAEPEPARLEYCLYLVKWALSLLKLS